MGRTSCDAYSIYCTYCLEAEYRIHSSLSRISLPNSQIYRACQDLSYDQCRSRCSYVTSVNSDEALLKFHRGQLLEIDEMWYRLVPPEAREVLDQKEVQRQSILFELVKSEKDYVADLELVQEVSCYPCYHDHVRRVSWRTTN